MQIQVRCTRMLHSGATKFYETVAIFEPETNRGVLVRRWGKVTQREGGGETKIEPFYAHSAAFNAARAIERDKGNRGYSVVHDVWGRTDEVFINGESTIDKSPEMIRLKLGHHYRDANVVEAIAGSLNLPTVGGFVIADDIVDETGEPEPELDRGSEWGSW